MSSVLDQNVNKPQPFNPQKMVTRNNAYHNSCFVAPAVILTLIYRDVKNGVLARRNQGRI
ncbi:hypothetical protein IGI04_020668 [Brassica rapa subsp. trilocularis]|uniref:Uncharacterized protein n=1 Tax=Brassica rapa subsp. trilocularis TaxID=1813537 RepID=A0ABQ7MJD4_BRACM|nr:hypothetical protein IGI04_020668 [Brassica rapa subsp. trilocularis]